MTEPEPRRSAPQLFEHNTLTIIGLLALLAGAILVGIGIATGNGSFLAGPDINELATKLTLISLGTTLLGAGFFAMIAALVLGGIRSLFLWQAGMTNTPPPKNSGSYSAK